MLRGVASSVVFAQEAAAAAGDRAVLHYFGAALGLGMIVIGAGARHRQASPPPPRKASRASRRAADKITGAVNLPLFLLEGVAILAEVFVLLIVLMNGVRRTVKRTRHE